VYAIETAKMSTKGQLVMPDSFRKRYGWHAGMTLLLIGMGDSVVVQAMELPDDAEMQRKVAESKMVASTVASRVRKARESLARLDRMGLEVPVGIENSAARRTALLEKHS